MTWIEVTQVLGNMGEFLGSLAVLITLIYLAIQIRLLRLQNLSDFDDKIANLYMDISWRATSDPATRRTLLRASKVVGSNWLLDPLASTLIEGGLEEEEVHSVGQFYNAIFIGHVNLYRTAPDQESAAIIERSYANNVIADPLFALWWETNYPRVQNETTTQEFVEKVNQVVRDEANAK